MKLIDKLAQKYSRKIGHTYSIIQREQHNAYVAGFCAAREMAARAVEMDQKIIRAIEACDEDKDLTLFDQGTKSRIEQMSNLGEDVAISAHKPSIPIQLSPVNDLLLATDLIDKAMASDNATDLFDAVEKMREIAKKVRTHV